MPVNGVPFRVLGGRGMETVRRDSCIRKAAIKHDGFSHYHGCRKIYSLQECHADVK